MSKALQRQRSGRLREAMSLAGLDVVVVAGDAWRSDYIRYAIDVTPMEGLALAIVWRDGAMQVFVESPAEASRIAAEQPMLEVSWGPAPMAQVEAVLADADAARVDEIILAARTHAQAAGTERTA